MTSLARHPFNPQPGTADKPQTEARRLAADYQRDFRQYDAEAVTAVDKFRQDKALKYGGNSPGLVDERLVAALTAAYREKKK